MPFDKSAETVPMFANVGVVDSIGEPKKSANSEFSTMPIKFKGSHGSDDSKATLVWLPEFCLPTFRIRNAKSLYGARAKAVEFVYHANFYEDGNISLLLALCGGDERLLDQLSEYVASVNGTDPANYDSVSTGTAIKDFLGQLGPVEFGYVTRQQRKEDPLTGKKTVRSKWREVDSYFVANEKGVTGIVKRAIKRSAWLSEQEAAGKDVSGSDEIVINFDTTVYGVELPQEMKAVAVPF